MPLWGTRSVRARHMRRMVLQLTLLGYILKPIFDYNSPYLVVGYGEGSSRRGRASSHLSMCMCYGGR